MKFEKYHNNKKKIIITVSVVLLITLTITLIGTRASYRKTQSIRIAEGTVNYSGGDFTIVAFKVQQTAGNVDDSNYTNSNSIPTGNYKINKTKSVCKYNNNGTEISVPANMYYDNTTGQVNIDINIKNKGTKCNLYFDIQDGKTVTELLASKTKVVSRTINGPVRTYDSSKIYYDIDDDGTTYYYVGAVTDNYVKFAGYTWRIIRVNGDGSIRLILDIKSYGMGIGQSRYNDSYSYNAYAGYMYGKIDSSSYTNEHKNTNSSTIKSLLENWYVDNISNTPYDKFVDKNAYFCNDRSTTTGTNSSYNTGLGYGAEKTTYGAYSRIYNNDAYRSTFIPTFKCSQDDDRLRYRKATTSKLGAKVLNYPIGLITADEVVYAGAYGSNCGGLETCAGYNPEFYLKKDMFTMSPGYFSGLMYMLSVQSDGQISRSTTATNLGTYPVINLVSTTIFENGGTGTSDNPYIVQDGNPN